jgi:pimeloyl-ACP methyl ester carboxylesterase
MRIPVVLVHGFIGNLHLGELRTHLDPASVFSPDLLGYGLYRGIPDENLTVPEQVRHLARYLDRELPGEQVVLVGHSAGVAVVMRYARQFPARVAAIVSAEGNLAPSDAFLSSRLAPMSAAEVEEWLDVARDNPAALMTSDGHRLTGPSLVRMTGWLSHQSAKTIHAAARAVLTETSRAGYQTDVRATMAAVPTFLVSGEKTPDAMRAPAWARDLAHGSFVIPRTGHLMVLEEPEEVSRCLSLVVDTVRRRY